LEELNITRASSYFVNISVLGSFILKPPSGNNFSQLPLDHPRKNFLWAQESVEITSHPSTPNFSQTVDLPQAIPPVIPTTILPGNETSISFLNHLISRQAWKLNKFYDNRLATIH
jgi:hypothetical protein